MTRSVRREQLEVGLERELALYAIVDDTVANLLANDRLLACFERLADDRWPRMCEDGWRLAPEYSRCLVEISSPPFPRERWPELLAGFALLEGWLARAAELLAPASRFDRIECTADYSVRSDRFVAWDGAVVTRFAALLLDPADENLLLGSPDDVPPCFAGAAPELGYACFTSTNATIHPAMVGDVDDTALADYCWRLLHVARQLDVASPQRHVFLRDGRFPVAPDPDRSIRDALIRWGEPDTTALLARLPIDDVAGFLDLVASPARPYSCRPRIVETTMLFELRCFHAGLPLANLAPLLDVELAR